MCTTKLRIKPKNEKSIRVHKTYAMVFEQDKVELKIEIATTNMQTTKKKQLMKG